MEPARDTQTSAELAADGREPDARESAGIDPAGLGLDGPPNRVIDARGLACPMPVIELAKGIEEVSTGEVVALLATDPAAGVDVPVWCRMRRQRLCHREERDGTWVFAVERAT